MNGGGPPDAGGGASEDGTCSGVSCRDGIAGVAGSFGSIGIDKWLRVQRRWPLGIYKAKEVPERDASATAQRPTIVSNSSTGIPTGSLFPTRTRAVMMARPRSGISRAVEARGAGMAR